MTVVLSASTIADKINKKLPQSIVEVQATALVVNSARLTDVMRYLKTIAGLEFDYLTSITATDYWEYFEVVYLITSLTRNQSITLKTRCHGRDNLSLPSVVSIFRAAEYQEREIFELLGIRFENHPDLRPLFLWEGFQGYPLRKDYL
jgi:NADH-quinone oxidoreductase subunit C